MLARMTMLGLLLGAILFPPQTAHGTEPEALTTCPGYRAALDDARGALTRGARAEAVLALERAKAALERCNRSDAGRSTLHAGRPVESAAARA